MASITDSISAPLHRSDSLSPSDLDLGLGGAHHVADDDDDVDDDDDDGLSGGEGEEFICPFCADHYDVVALFCHIDDQHPLDANTGKGLIPRISSRTNWSVCEIGKEHVQVCPVCAKNVRADFVGHITKEHGNFLKMQRNTRFRKAGSNSMLRKELQEGALQSLYGGSSCMASSNCEPDPLLSSFIFTPVVPDEPPSAQPCPFEATQELESSQEEFLERKPEQLQLLDKDQVENARRFEFVHGLLMSTVLDDNL